MSAVVRSISTIVVAVFLFVSSLAAAGSGAEGLAGWDAEGEYNGFYKASELDQLKGSVDAVKEIRPMGGMAPGVGLSVRDQDGDLVEVHLGPKAYVKVESIGLQKGDKVKVRGAWAEIGGKEVFMASKVKKGEDSELKVRRSKDGMPYWAMTPEELAKEGEEQR